MTNETTTAPIVAHIEERPLRVTLGAETDRPIFDGSDPADAIPLTMTGLRMLARGLAVRVAFRFIMADGATNPHNHLRDGIAIVPTGDGCALVVAVDAARGMGMPFVALDGSQAAALMESAVCAALDLSALGG